MPQIRIPEIRERVELIYMKSGLLTTRLYIWIVTISLAPVRQEFFGRAWLRYVKNFSAGLPRLVQADQAPVTILE
jgi:hypothetical protein